MPLVSKMIRYPNELEAMGLATNGKTNVQGSVTPSQETIKNAIIDIITFFNVDLDMPIVPTDGELNISNIVDIPNIQVYASQSNVVNTGQKYFYGFKVFAFNDELQESKPLFIKLNFGLMNASMRYNAPGYKARFAFFVDLDIIHNSAVIHSFTLANIHYNTSTYNSDPYNYYLYDVVNSIGIRNNNSIFVNIFPKKFYTYYDQDTNLNSNVRSSYIGFYMERNAEYIKFLPLCRIIPTPNSSHTYSNLSENFIYIPYSGNDKYSTNLNCNIPYVSNKIIANNSNTSFKTIDINPVTNVINENTNVLTTYSIQSANNTLSDVTVDGEVHQYYVYKPEPLVNLIYVYSMNISLLFKVS